MYVFAFTYQYTEYLRTPAAGGMDSEPAGTKVSESTYRVLVDGKLPTDRLFAEQYVKRIYGDDKNFHLLSVSEPMQLDAILRVQHRLRY